MSDLCGERGELAIVVTVKRAATGKEETYLLTSVVEGEDARKAKRIAEELKNKEQSDGGNALDGK